MKLYTSLIVFAVLAIGLTASAQGPTVVFSNIAASPTSDVPGLPGRKFNPGTGSQFDRPFASPNGQLWIFGAVVDGTTDQDVIITGMGLTSAGSQYRVLQGDATGFASGETYTALRTQMDINNSGHFAFNADTSGATTQDDMVVRWDGSFGLMAREGVAAPGQGAGIGYGSTNNAVNITSSSDVMFRSASLTGATTQQVLFKNSSISIGSVIAQTDTTSPLGQFTLPSQTIDNLSSDRFRTDATGSNYLYHGDLNGGTTTDLFMVRNDTVLAQEGSILPGSGFASAVSALSSGTGSQQISDNGAHYLFRGNNADLIDWVYRDGAVVARTDGPIFTGATELFDDAIFSTTFFINATNSMGDYIIGGVTNQPDVNKNAVLVLNSTQVVLREGDPVDVDGNGLFDDDAFVSVFNDDDSFLTDDLWYFFNADLRNGAGTSIGQAFLRMRVPEPTTLSFLALAGLGLLRRRR